MSLSLTAGATPLTGQQSGTPAARGAQAACPWTECLPPRPVAPNQEFSQEDHSRSLLRGGVSGKVPWTWRSRWRHQRGPGSTCPGSSPRCAPMVLSTFCRAGGHIPCHHRGPCRRSCRWWFSRESAAPRASAPIQGLHQNGSVHGFPGLGWFRDCWCSRAT